jgi:cell wall-associated NlpC family hydrolase
MRGTHTRPLGLPVSRTRSLCIAAGIVGAVVALLPPNVAAAKARRGHSRQAHGGNTSARAGTHVARGGPCTEHTKRAAKRRTRARSNRRASTSRRQRVARRPADPAKLVMPEIAEGDGSSVLEAAAHFLGRPYRFGAAGTDSFDCSGFVLYVYGTVGIDLPHSAQEQFGLGDAVTRDELEPGDLVFFGERRVTHVGIFVGNDKFVHAATRPGRVQVDSLADGYYASVFRGARRIEG